MKHGDSQSQQTGFALVLSLLILLVMMVLGVAALNSTIMQERMAGNARTQAEVFETSSEGVTRSLELFYNNAEDFTFGDYNLSCGQVFGDMNGNGSLADETSEAWIFPDDGSWHLASEAGDNPTLDQRMYCCRSWDEVDDGAGGTVWVEHTSKLYALSRATLFGGADNDQPLALREIEVEMAEAEPDDPTCAICVPGNMGTVSGPNSGSLNVSGSCGAAVVTDQATDPNAAATFINGIGHAAIGNFDGGIIGGEISAPWSNPAELAEFVFWVKLGLLPGSAPGDAGVGDSNVRSLYINGDYSDTGNNSYGTTANPQITYIDGDASFGGNVSGAGILITRGTLSWNGTPDFNGLLVSLGGGYIVSGGGKGGNPSGSMVFTELDYVDLGGDDPQDLFDRHVLRYEVARDDDEQHVRMYYPPGQPCDNSLDVCGSDLTGEDVTSYTDGSDYLVPARPILLGDTSALPGSNEVELIHYHDASTNQHHFFAADDFFQHSQGDELNATYLGSGNFEITVDFLDTAGVTISAVVPLKRPPDTNGDGFPEPARDAFGRLIPNFVPLLDIPVPDNYPEAYGYNPNRWNWDPTLADTQFEWGETDFSWSGGGNQNFTYDCRALQNVKHELLCAQQLQPLPGNPNDGFYEDPDSFYGDYCWHSVAGVEGGTGGAADGKYYDGYATPPTTGRPENQRAWHMWSPSCDCLGISVDADMIVTGWRENLGWRDDEEFLGCSGLPSPGG